MKSVRTTPELVFAIACFSKMYPHPHVFLWFAGKPVLLMGDQDQYIDGDILSRHAVAKFLGLELDAPMYVRYENGVWDLVETFQIEPHMHNLQVAKDWWPAANF